MARTCCPQYTIRLDVKAFEPGKKHRQVMNRFNRYLSTGSKPGEGSGAEDRDNKGKGKAKVEESWVSGLREYEVGYGKEGKHRYTVRTDFVL